MILLRNDIIATIIITMFYCYNESVKLILSM